MLTKLVCENYRGLEAFEITFSPLTTLVGPNGSGKSTVLQALDFLLGERWASLSQMDIPGDFTALDNTRSMMIQAWFDPSLEYEDAMGTAHQIGAIEYRCQPYKRRSGSNLPGDLRDQYRPLSPAGNEVTVCTRGPQKNTRPVFAPLISMNSGLRDQARVLSIPTARTVSGHLPGRRGSIMARLLTEARASFLRDSSGERTRFKAQYASAVAALRTEQLRDVETSIADTARRMLGFKGSSAAANLSVEFGFADPGNPHSALRLLCKQDGLLLPAEALGAGEQSALVVGLFEAFRSRGAALSTILLEEPEMYLYPQAQRYFKKILADLVDQHGAQIILTTHSPIFADASRFRELRLLRRNASYNTTVSRVSDARDVAFLEDQLKREKLEQYVDSRNSELLFARAVLLVEGHGDRLGALYVASEIGLDLDAEGLSIVACGGKSGIPFFARLCRSLRIPFAVLHDTDIYAGTNLAQWQVDETKSAPAKNAVIVEAAGSDATIIQVSPTLEAVLGIGRSASDKPMRVLAALQSAGLENVPPELRQAVEALAKLVGIEI